VEWWVRSDRGLSRMLAHPLFNGGAWRESMIKIAREAAL
jgi:hypothetical protein